MKPQKIDQYIQAFLQKHAKRLREEETLALIPTPEIEITPLIKAIIEERTAIKKISLLHAHQAVLDIEHYNQIAGTHHILMNELISAYNKHVERANIPTFENSEKLSEFIKEGREAVLYDKAEKAHDARLNAEARVTLCNEKDVPALCKHIHSLMKIEMSLKSEHRTYINWKNQNPTKPSWRDFSTNHHSKLVALASDTHPLIDLPATVQDLNEGDYAKQLEAFVHTARFLHPPQPVQIAPPAPTPTPQASQQNNTPVAASPILAPSNPPAPRPVSSGFNRVLKHPITHMFLCAGVAAFFPVTWLYVGTVGLACGVSSLLYQMGRRLLIEYWVKKAILEKTRYSKNTHAAKSFQYGFESKLSLSTYIKSWFIPSTYLLPAYYIGCHTAEQGLPLESRLNDLDAKILEKTVSSSRLQI